MTGSSARTISVYLVDAHPIVRESFAHAIDDEGDLVVVGQAGTAAGALAETSMAQPDVVLVNLDIPDRDGIELLCALRAQLPHTKLLVLGGHDDEFRIAEALRASAHGYLVKTSRIEEVIAGIRNVAGGGAPIRANIASAVVRAMRKPVGAEGSSGLESLTQRERQVLGLLAGGMSTRDMAARLTINPKTVETHRVRIYAKLGCESAEELSRVVRQWRKRGPPPAAAAAVALVPGPRPPSLVDAVTEPDD